METPAAVHELHLSLLENLRAPLSMLARSLGADDPAESLAAARALTRRFYEGLDKPQSLVECISSTRIFSLPFATQAALADLALAGLPIEIPEAPADLAPELSCRYRAVEIAKSPGFLSLSRISVLELRALEMIPVGRAIDTGLWQRLAGHARPAVHERVLHWIDQALEHALLSPEDAARVILEIAQGSSEAIAARALDLLAKPWALHLVCPPLQSFMKGEEVACAAVRVAEARHDRAWLRRLATDEHAARAVRSAALQALGGLGEATDMEIVVAMLDECPEKFGAAALSALLHCKWRGLSPDTDQAHVIIEVALRHEAFSLDMAAEITSSRADNLLSFLDELLRSAISKRRIAHLLGAWSTGKTLARLFEMAQNAHDPISSRAAIRELGRLEERSAEPLLLDQLAREPEECLLALGKVGGIATVQRLRAFMTDDAPAWIGIALETLFKLDPAPDVLVAAIEHGAISPHVLEALPVYASAGQTKALADIVLAPGHPYRSSAVGALGRTGGPLAIDPLAQLLTDGDENIRESAKKALAALGGRLALREASPLACLEQATDPGATLIAEAALRRLRGRTESTAETMLLLDAAQGNAHPQLVRVVRPYLTRNNPEIRKRAIACLGVLGAPCSAWVLPHLRPDEPLPVIRQALLALGRAGVRGLGARFVPWLEHGNMNIKKTAAEILAHIDDPIVIKPLVDVLAWQDQPGLRTLCEQALRANAGKFVRSLVIEKLVRTDEPRKRDYLSSILAGSFLAEDFAGLLSRRPEIPQVLVRMVIAAHAREAPLFAAAFRRRGIEARIPKETDVAGQDPLRVELAQADMALWVAELRRYLREMAFSTIAAPEWTSVLARVAETGQSWAKELSIEEQRILASRLPFVEDPVRRDIVALLAASTDLFVRSRIVPFVDVRGKLAPHVGPILAEVVRQGKPETARGFLDHGDDRVRAAAARVLLLSGSFEFPHDRVSERIEVIRAFVETGREAYLSTWILGQDAISLQEAVTRIAGHSGKSAAWDFALK
ncbi:MAG TPA: HEAT repeat domain-containing protein, partial [Polyangium sp.]|nr:HEAT repeat domain-containing protein [Polyangium sp.]